MIRDYMGPGHMIDTSGINDAVDGRVDLAECRVQYGPGFITKHTRREIDATTDDDRRRQLHECVVRYELVELDSVTARAATCCPADADILFKEFEDIAAEVVRYTPTTGQRARRNARVDALHAEVAERCGLVLVAGDQGLVDAAKARGVRVKNTKDP
jgi:hypothetical protein